jgi:hypothetical protein
VGQYRKFTNILDGKTGIYDETPAIKEDQNLSALKTTNKTTSIWITIRDKSVKLLKSSWLIISSIIALSGFYKTGKDLGWW